MNNLEIAFPIKNQILGKAVELYMLLSFISDISSKAVIQIKLPKKESRPNIYEL